MSLFLKLFMILQGIVLVHWLKEVREGKVPFYKVGLGYFCIATMSIFAAIFLPFDNIMKIMFVIAGCLLLIYSITVAEDGFGKTMEDAIIWIRFMYGMLAVTGLITLYLGLPDTKMEFESTLLGLASGNLVWVYPMLMGRLNKSRTEQDK